jgi:hypothetical protein
MWKIKKVSPECYFISEDYNILTGVYNNYGKRYKSTYDIWEENNAPRPTREQIIQDIEDRVVPVALLQIEPDEEYKKQTYADCVDLYEKYNKTEPKIKTVYKQKPMKKKTLTKKKPDSRAVILSIKDIQLLKYYHTPILEKHLNIKDCISTEDINGMFRFFQRMSYSDPDSGTYNRNRFCSPNIDTIRRFIIMKSMAYSLYQYIKKKDEIYVLDKPKLYNIMFHIIAKGQVFYNATCDDADFCLYLVSNHNKLYDDMRQASSEFYQTVEYQIPATHRTPA